MARKHIIISGILSIIIFTACSEKPVDVLVAEDGTVFSGDLLAIESGKAIFSTGTVEVPDRGNIWCLNGRVFSGEITSSDGVFRSGSISVSEDSVYRVVWGDSEIQQRTFTVDAMLGWVDTDIYLETGEILSLNSTGTVVTETGTSSPQGQEKFSSSVSLAPGATSGQLVFKVGEGGQPVAAGSSWLGESPGEGTLMLAVNVPLEGSLGARGIYTVIANTGTSGTRSGTAAFYPASR